MCLLQTVSNHEILFCLSDDLHSSLFSFAFTYRFPKELHWKLSSTENFQRMRLKFKRNYTFTAHTDASRTRDNITDEVDARVASVPVRVAKEAVVQNVDEDKLEDDDPASPTGKATRERMRAISETERTLLG